MSDFFDGKIIHKSIHDPDALAMGWIQINGKNAHPTPSCDSRYWKIEDGEIVEMTASEKEIIDTPPVILKTAKQIYSEIFDAFGPAAVVSKLKPVLTPFFDTCIRQESENGFALAKAEIDLTSLTTTDKNKIKNIIG